MGNFSSGKRSRNDGPDVCETDGGCVVNSGKQRAPAVAGSKVGIACGEAPGELIEVHGVLAFHRWPKSPTADQLPSPPLKSVDYWTRCAD